MIKICAVIPAISQNDLRNQVIKIKKSNPDFIEVRLDYLTGEVNLKEIRELTSTSLIATNRSKTEGGKYRGTEAARVNLLFEAAKSSFDYVDVEFQTRKIADIISEIKKIGAQTILSIHNFSSTPPLVDMMRELERMKETGADVYKYITKANSLEDNLKILQFVNATSKQSAIISFCLGQLGVSSRILSPLLGSFLTYASLEDGKETAPGQLSIGVIKQLYKMIKVHKE